MSLNLLLNPHQSPFDTEHADPPNCIESSVFHSPLDKISQVLRVETQIIDTFKESLNLQHEAFDFKYTTFNQLLQEFRIKLSQDEAEILEAYAFEDRQYTKPQKDNVPKNYREIPKKAESNFIQNSRKDDSFEAEKEEKPKRGKRGARKAKPLIMPEPCEEKVEVPQIIPPVESRREDNENSAISNSESESEDFEKIEQIMPSLGNGGTSVNFTIESDHKDRYEISRRRIEEVIQKRGNIKKHYGKLGEILFHPYSTIQMLLDYNESSAYPLVKIKKTGKDGDSDEDSD